MLNDIVDYAIDTIKQTKKYRMVVSDSNSSSFKVPESGIRKIGSLPFERKIYSYSNRDRTSDHFDHKQHKGQSQKMLSEKLAVKKPVLSTSRRASSDNNRLYHRSSSESEIAQRYSFIDPQSEEAKVMYSGEERKQGSAEEEYKRRVQS